MKWQIPLFQIDWSEDDITKVSKVIRRGMSWAAGPEVSEFERKLAEYLGLKHAVTFNSGTSALHAVMLAYGIGAGDEVIVPSFTFIATANAPLFVGAKPVFADIDESTLGLDPDDVRRKITSRTKAILPIHYAGYPCKVAELAAIAKENNLVLIEDTAEALGAKVNGQKTGTFGESAIFSFCQNKIITTGEGGAVTTSSDVIYRKLKLICSQGRKEAKSSYFSSVEDMDYIQLGYNFRMSAITAALGLAQLARIDEIIRKRREKAAYFMNVLADINGLNIPFIPEKGYNIYQMFPVRINSGDVTRNALRNYLAENGIMSRVYFQPVHLSRYFRQVFGYRDGELPITEKISGEILSLPLFPTMQERDIVYIAEKIKNFFGERSANA